jgi:uncharacterized membrane protein
MNWEGLRLLLPRPVRELPADLAAVLALVATTGLAVFLPGLSDSPVRVVVGLAFVLFVPGYAFVAMLFPEAGGPPAGRAGQEADTSAGAAGDDGPEETDGNPVPDEAVGPAGDRGIDGLERVALSFGLSIAVVPLLGLALNFTPFGIRLVPIVVTLGGFTAASTAVAAWRRRQLPSAERFRVPYRAWLAAARREVLDPPTRLDAALNVALAVAVLLAASSVVYAVAVPPQGEQFTELYLLTEDEDGELVADGYPDSFTPGESESLYVGVGNHEHETVEYTVVVQLQRVEGEGNDSRVTDRERLDTFTATVAHNETWTAERSLTVDGDVTGEDLRLSFLLYEGDPPAAPTRANAYRDVHLWVDVEG